MHGVHSYRSYRCNAVLMVDSSAWLRIPMICCFQIFAGLPSNLFVKRMSHVDSVEEDEVWKAVNEEVRKRGRLAHGTEVLIPR